MDSSHDSVIFIAGVDLSGSTVLDLLLGTVPGVVGLGEIDNILDSAKRGEGEAKNGPIKSERCSCGLRGFECPVWGPTMEFISAHPESSFAERFKFLVERARNAEGAQIVVDSSKQISALRHHIDAWQQLETQAKSFQIILLRRSPVSWLLSDLRRSRRRGQTRSLKIQRRRLRKWSNRYLVLLEATRKHSGPVQFLSLSGLQKNPKKILQSIHLLDQQGLIVPDLVNLKKSRSHVLWGSHHRFDPSRSRQITVQSRAPISDWIFAAIGVLSYPYAIGTNFRLLVAELSQQIPRRK